MTEQSTPEEVGAKTKKKRKKKKKGGQATEASATGNNTSATAAKSTSDSPPLATFHRASQPIQSSNLFALLMEVDENNVPAKVFSSLHFPLQRKKLLSSPLPLMCCICPTYNLNCRMPVKR